jgi:hypothetical protein
MKNENQPTGKRSPLLEKPSDYGAGAGCGDSLLSLPSQGVPCRRQHTGCNAFTLCDPRRGRRPGHRVRRAVSRARDRLASHR